MATSTTRARITTFFTTSWARFMGLSRRTQIVIVIICVLIVGGILVLARSGGGDATGTAVPSVTLARVDSFGDSVNGVDVLGTVQSISQADLLAQSAGTVEAVHTTLGATVPAGFVIADLDSAAASAAVLQAQGGYDSALAAEKATSLQSQNSSGSFAEEQTSVRTSYTSAYATVQSVLTNDVDQSFGNNTPVGPALLLNPLTTNNTLPRERRDITTLMTTWQGTLANVNSTDPLALLSTEQQYLTTVASFITDLSNLANTQGSGATPAQLGAIATAQSTVNGLIAGISTARTAYNGAETSAAIGQTQSGASTGVTSSEAVVEQALGALRSAQAAYEKTIIRAPIAGTINYLPIKVGDYVSMNQKVATVARNNALEVVLYLSQDNRERVAVGDAVMVAGTYKGIVTTISPALDPVTKQIEVDVAVDDSAALVNGQSVQVTLPQVSSTATPLPTVASARAASSTSASTTATIQLPLSAVKLLPNERDVFTVDATNHLVAHPVDIGDVVGDRIEITTPLAPDLEIVTDARGLSAGESVLVASSTPQ